MDNKKKPAAKPAAKAKNTNVKAAKVEKVKPVKAPKVKREKHKFGWRDAFVIIGIVLTLAIAGVNGYYLAHSSVATAQHYAYHRTAEKAAAVANGVDLTLGSSPMYASLYYAAALMVGSLLIIGILSRRKSVVNYLIYAIGTPVAIMLTYFLALNGKVAGIDTYFAYFHNFIRLFVLLTLCGGIFLSIFTLMCEILDYRRHVRKGDMPDWDDLDSAQLAAPQEPEPEGQPA